MERFKKIYQQGIVDVVEIWVDTQCFSQKRKCGRIYPIA